MSFVLMWTNYGPESEHLGRNLGHLNILFVVYLVGPS